MSLLHDSNYEGDDEKCICRYNSVAQAVPHIDDENDKNITYRYITHRARFCKQAIALSVSIKNHFARVLNQQSDRSALTQILLPFPMPAHLEKDYEIVSSCSECARSASDIDCCNPDDVLKGDRFSPTSLAICSQCVNLVDYTDYLTDVMKEVVVKGANRRYRGPSTERQSCKRAHVAEQSTSDCGRTRAYSMSERGCPATVVGETEDFTTGSALLLGMKRSRVDKMGLAGDSVSSQEAGVNETAFAPFSHTLFPAGAYSGLFPSTRADTPEMFAPDDVLAVTEGGDQRGASLSIAVGYSEQDVTAGGGVTVDDGRSLHEFLLACYRDGIYPSPAAGGTHQRQQQQHCGAVEFPAEDGTTAPSFTDTGTETDSDGAAGVGGCAVVPGTDDGAAGSAGGTAAGDLGYEDLQMLLAHLLPDSHPATAVPATRG